MASSKNSFLNTRNIIIYIITLAILVFALKWLQMHFLIEDDNIDLYIGLIAVILLTLGIWISGKFSKPEAEITVEQEVEIVKAAEEKFGESEIGKVNLSLREYEVLQVLVKGYTNAEIAGELFLSLNTVKTHIASIYEKMDVKNRPQAIEKAKRLKMTL